MNPIRSAEQAFMQVLVLIRLHYIRTEVGVAHQIFFWFVYRRSDPLVYLFQRTPIFEPKVYQLARKYAEVQDLTLRTIYIELQVVLDIVSNYKKVVNIARITST